VGEEGEEFEDLEGGTSPSGGPWLPPEDRLWRHPSEMAGLQPDAPRRRRGYLHRPTTPRRWWALASAALAGAVVATGATTALATTVFSGHAGPSSALAHGRAYPAGDPPASTTSRLSSGPRTPTTDAVPVTKGFMALVNRLSPALVAVDTKGAQGTRDGSGLVFTTNGMIMTSAGLVSHQSTINVVTSSGQEWAATLVGQDRTTGIAVIRVQTAGLTPAPLGTASGLVPGQLTVAVSSSPSPYGKPSVVVGSIQGVQDTITLANGSQLADGIEADIPARVNQAGGALLDENGDVVGIVQGAVQGSNNDTMLAATPIDDASSAASQLAATGQVVRAYLGVLGRNVVPGDQPSLGTATGVEVYEVMPKSPAAIAGLQPGDVITAFNGQPVATAGALQHLLDEAHPNTTVTLSIIVQQVPRTVPVTLGTDRE
jgi:S1-C subfamily serine protease